MAEKSWKANLISPRDLITTTRYTIVLLKVTRSHCPIFKIELRDLKYILIDEELIKKFPSFCHPNIWPEEMPELEPAFLNMGRLVVDVGTLLARHVDKYVKSQLATYEEGKLETIIKTSKTAKGRLLHYFPLKDSDLINYNESDNVDFSSWCGWHNDHGSLTGLVPPMHFDDEGKEVPNPDPSSGRSYTTHLSSR